MDTRPGVKPDTLVRELVQRWLTENTGQLASRENSQAMRGFQWRDVFLPEGTCLRTYHAAKAEFAKLIGDHIVADDGSVLTPSLFANRNAKGRNAWRFVWLRFPHDDCWIRADDCREQCGKAMRRQSKEGMERSRKS
jgi:hypothetical protein